MKAIEKAQAPPITSGGYSLARHVERWSSLLLIVTLIIVWEAGVRAFDVPRFVLPTPSEIGRLATNEWSLVEMHSLATICTIVTGYAAAVTFALAISALMIRFPLSERLIMPNFVGLQSVPEIAIAPLILVWVGAGIGWKVLVVMSITFFPIVINTMAGFKEVYRELADAFRSIADTEREMLLGLRLRYAVPYIFAGLRIGATMAVHGRHCGRMACRFEWPVTFFNLASWIEQRISWRTGLTIDLGSTRAARFGAIRSIMTACVHELLCLSTGSDLDQNRQLGGTASPLCRRKFLRLERLRWPGHRGR